MSSETPHSFSRLYRSIISVGKSAQRLSIYVFANGIGAESVSGYIRSAPGKTRSKIVLPSSNDFLVSGGTPSKAIKHRSSIVSRAVFISSEFPQKTNCASSPLAFKIFLIFSKSISEIPGSRHSECVILGFSMQAITFRRSEISCANTWPSWVKCDKMPANLGKLTAQI